MFDAKSALTLPAADLQGRSTPLLSTLSCVSIGLLGVAIFLLSQLPHVRQVLDLVLPDHDDAIRLLGVRDLLAGQSWFDTHQYRYLPPDGALMHWSRLVDAPLAAAIWLLRPFLGQPAAEATVAMVWPLLLFGGYLALVAAVLRDIAARMAALLAILVACQMVVFQYVFGVGRIDHHGLQVFLISLAALPFAFYGRMRRAPEASGLAAALSLAVGLETLPFVAVVGIANVIPWVLGEDDATARLTRFSMTFAATLLVAFGVQTSPELWASPVCDMLSLPWLLIGCGGALIAMALALATPRLTTPALRLAAAAAGVVVLIGLFVLAYPKCLAGPYEMVPEPYRSIWISDIPEAWPGLIRLAQGSDTIFQAFGPLLAAALAALVLALHSAGPMRRLMAISAGCLWAGVALSLLQVRGLYVVSTFIPPVAGLAGWRIVEALRGGQITGFRATAAVLAGLAFLGFVWSAPALAVRKLAPVFGPGGHPPSDCLTKQSISALGSLPPGLILAPIDLGAYTLLHTRHSIIAAGFHRAADGIIAGIDAFKGSEADMRRVIRTHAPYYLVICADWAKAATPPPFAKALTEGLSVPWLEPLPLDAGGLRVWRVLPEALPLE
ncbi:MAG: hypothetical protein ACRED5_02845 [Propylenella sp.]